MPRYSYDRLSHESAGLLEHESSRRFQHSGATLIFEPGPLATEDGGIDFASIRSAIESRLHRVPQYRRKLRWVPVENHPVWVDDREFNLDYHLRHTSLARPGGHAELQKVAARVQSQRLDRSRPLWEGWVLEGMSGGRFALVLKTHNVMVDGAGADLLQVLLSPDPDESYEAPPQYRPRPVPSAVELVRDEVLRQARLPRRMLRRLRSFIGDTENLADDLRHRADSIARMVGYTLKRLPETPLNGEVGPHRRFAHLSLPLDEAKSVRTELGGTVHDVVLTVVTGAVARYLRAHHVNPATLDFRAAVPMSLRRGERNEGVEEWILELPVWERDPIRRFQLVRERTEAMNEESPAIGAKTLFSTAGWTSTRMIALASRSIRGAAVHLSITNVPGPQVPLYLKGAKLVEAYGKVPLRHNGGLGIAVMSYDGKLCFGFNADFDLVPDLDVFTDALQASFEELVREAARRGRSIALVGA
ncbi:MAG: wax ester/triacylglycerol synthase family O-acyltransferase [Deltaproteobacteria bacterium]|nr:wax ester/triacylglycerol synthase family O-acyltransferase [Deltaproteobacteria bacterium]